MSTRKYKVLVTGVGAIIGYGIIHNLKASRFDVEIIGIDIYDDAVGRHWCDKFIQGVYANSPDFISFINKIIEDESVDLVLPGIEQDLDSFILHRDELSSKAEFVLNNYELNEILNDKKLTADHLEECCTTIPHIEFSTTQFEDGKSKFGLPFILKKCISYASKGVKIIEDIDDYRYWIKKFGTDCIVQKLLDIEDNEYTVSIFGLGDGQFVNPICLQRELSPEGATKKAMSVSIEPKLMQLLRSITEHCRFVGPTNLQFVKNDELYYLLEINPRISSSTSIRRILGVNEQEMCIEFYLEKITPEERSVSGGKVIRYISDQLDDSYSL